MLDPGVLPLRPNKSGEHNIVLGVGNFKSGPEAEHLTKVSGIRISAIEVATVRIVCRKEITEKRKKSFAHDVLSP